MISALFSEFVQEATQADVLVSAVYRSLGTDEFTLEFADSDEGRVLLEALEQRVLTLEPSADDQRPTINVVGNAMTVMSSDP